MQHCADPSAAPQRNSDWQRIDTLKCPRTAKDTPIPRTCP